MKKEYERITALKGIQEADVLMENNANNYRREYMQMREQEFTDNKWRQDDQWTRDIEKVQLDANTIKTKKKKGKGKGKGTK